MAENIDIAQPAAGTAPGGLILGSPDARARSARISSAFWFMTASVIAAIGIDHDRINAVTITAIALCCAIATLLPLIDWDERSPNTFAWTYVGGVVVFGSAALYFDNAYILLGIYPSLVALADVYWNKRSLMIVLFTLISALFVLCAAVIEGPGRTNILVAAPVIIATALVFGDVTNHLVQSQLARKRFVATVKSLLEALYMRDGYSGSHSRATLALTEAVADEMNLPAAQRVDLADAALLHDVGKIGIPNAILQKPGRLDPEEWEVMRTHPVIGEQIVSDVPGFENLAKAIRYEHERWDGDGYPDGIAGEAIPLASRIVFACDAFHAMTSDRPYRSAMTRDEARAELRSNAGTQFDPRVIDALIAVIDRHDALQHRAQIGETSVDPPPWLAEIVSQYPASVVNGAAGQDASSSPVDRSSITAAIPIDSGRAPDQTTIHDDDQEELPGTNRVRTAMSTGAWILSSIVLASYLVVNGYSTDGASFLALFALITAVAFALHNSTPRWWVLGSGLLAYVLVPLAAWRLEEPALLVCLIIPAAATMALFWESRPLRILQYLLLLNAFIVTPLLTVAEQSLTFVAVSIRAFPGVIFATAVTFPQVRRTSFDRERFSATMSSLLRALQARDGYTGDHSEETLKLTMRVAFELNLDEAKCAELKDVSLLHDIGKIGIPDEILHKPGKLTDAEWEVMRTHPEIGQRIVDEIPGFESVAKAIRHEHERWDGGGYPDGIAGNEIPLASRIVLVCDAFHAMTSDRPYRASLGRHQALEELAKHSGTQFDPVVVAALLKSLAAESVGAAPAEVQPVRVAIG